MGRGVTHIEHRVYMAVPAALVVLGAAVITLYLLLSAPTWLYYATAGAVFLTVPSISGLHGRQPCLWCADNPLADGEPEVKRHRVALSVWHTSVPAIAAEIGAVVFISTVISLVIVASIPSHPDHFAILVLSVVGGIVEWRTERLHSMLAPWCPWCRRDDHAGPALAGGSHDH